MTACLTLADVISRTNPLVPFAEGDNIPWNDPAFSARMLREHLSQDHELASRTTPIIGQHVQWLHETVLDCRPSRVLDLGCGPGLYLHRLAHLGHTTVGIDFGPASIEYARQTAAAQGLDGEFRLEDLRHAEFGHGHDLVMMLYGQLNVFRREEASDLMRRAHAALRPGGKLVIEPQTASAIRGDGQPSSHWSTATSGLFSDRPHLLLHERAWDEASRSATERWFVIDTETAAVSRYAMTTVAYEVDDLGSLLRDAVFHDIEVLDGLPGNQDSVGLWALVATA